MTVYQGLSGLTNNNNQVKCDPFLITYLQDILCRWLITLMAEVVLNIVYVPSLFIICDNKTQYGTDACVKYVNFVYTFWDIILTMEFRGGPSVWLEEERMIWGMFSNFRSWTSHRIVLDCASTSRRFAMY